MILEENDNVAEQKYRVMTVEKTLPPDGMTGDWYHYVIGEGNSRIDGKKGGSLQAVREHAETVAATLNNRAASRSYSTYAVRKKK